MDDSAIVNIVIAVLVGGFLLVWAGSLLLILALHTLRGAVKILAHAEKQGFIGLAAYLALWVFLFPVMLPLCIFVGWLDAKSQEAEDAAHLERHYRNMPFPK